MNTTTNAIVSQTNHCFRLTFIAIVPPAQSPLLGYPPTEDSTRLGDRGSTCTFGNFCLSQFRRPQKWHHTGLTESHSRTASPLVARGKCRSAALAGHVDGLPAPKGTCL